MSRSGLTKLAPPGVSFSLTGSVRRVWDGSGWRAFAFVGTYVRGDLRLVPLPFSDARTFESEVAAHAATVILACAWIDTQD